MPHPARGPPRTVMPHGAHVTCTLPPAHRAVWIFLLPAGWGRVPPPASSALPHTGSQATNLQDGRRPYGWHRDWSQTTGGVSALPPGDASVAAE